MNISPIFQPQIMETETRHTADSTIETPEISEPEEGTLEAVIKRFMLSDLRMSIFNSEEIKVEW